MTIIVENCKNIGAKIFVILYVNCFIYCYYDFNPRSIFEKFLFHFLRNETVLFSAQGSTIYIVIWMYPIRAKFVIVNVNTVEIRSFATKCGVLNISIAALFENGELRLKLLLLVIILHKKIMNWTSNRIVIVKKGNTFSRWRHHHTKRFVH